MESVFKLFELKSYSILFCDRRSLQKLTKLWIIIIKYDLFMKVIQPYNKNMYQYQMQVKYCIIYEYLREQVRK